MNDFFHEIAEKTSIDTNKVRQAYQRGEERYQAFNKELTERINNLGTEEIFSFETPCPANNGHDCRRTIAFIGRSYNLFDPFINKDLLALAKGLGIKVITSNAIPVRERERMVVPLSKEIYWETSREIVGSILYVAEKKIADGIIFVSSFKCGIDALMQEFLKRQVGTNKKGNIPFMTLTFDEHTSVEGTRTRLEAFLDLIDQRKGDEG
jgi:predicted nucleotide-binding protein (sugar kinase/HSP70/actin superfamily)